MSSPQTHGALGEATNAPGVLLVLGGGQHERRGEVLPPDAGRARRARRAGCRGSGASRAS